MIKTAGRFDKPNLTAVQDIIVLANADHLIDDGECLFLYKLNWSKNLYLPYHNYEKSYLDSLSEGECKSDSRFDKRDI